MTLTFSDRVVRKTKAVVVMTAVREATYDMYVRTAVVEYRCRKYIPGINSQSTAAVGLLV